MTRPQFTRKELIGNNNTGNSTVGVNGDGSLNVQSTILAYNGSSSDRIYNNTQGTLLASSARTATINSPIQTNYNAKGIMVFLNVTVASGTGGLKPVIIVNDPVSSASIQINPTPNPITAIGIYGFLVYPGSNSSTGGTNYTIVQATNNALSRSFLVQIQTGDSSSYTYSVGYSLIN